MNDVNSNPFERWRHIVIEGPIGAGKTTLTRRLSERFGVPAVLEDPQANPFLERFYRDSARYALPTQLSFLFQRMDRLRDMTQSAAFEQASVGDFLLEKDRIFARLTLAEDELALYRQIFDSLHPQAPTPDLVIYLQAEPDSLVERVRRRGLAMEAAVSEDYLRALADAYSRFFHHYDTSPLLMVNAEHLNPIERSDDFALLMERIASMRGKREFFNRGE
jgi:deoxyadenosine/deoxycytidine kinase